jgi:diguanylate cyclase (GGDEF)-like protein
MEALKMDSLAHLRHEFKTPVNHILGYSELLLEEAEERRLGPFIPAFQQIQSSGRKLLESIESGLPAGQASVREGQLEAFKGDLRETIAEVMETTTSLLADLEERHRQTVADLDAIAWAICRLGELAGEGKQRDGTPVTGARQKAEPPAPESRADAPREVTRPKRPGGRILVADDDRANRNLLRRRLEYEGHQVWEAKNGVEVLAMLKEHTVDLLLLDIIMPEMDGFETLAWLKQDAQLRELPVIMISAVDEMRGVVRCIEMGAEAYLPKPFDRVLLRARVDDSLEKKRLRDGERRKTVELEQTLALLGEVQIQLRVQASMDPLTGLANRRSVEAKMVQRFLLDAPLSVIYIDLNGFKKVNDTYGHQAGDELLKQAADRLRAAFRSTDVIGRWGGDEFVALVDGDIGVAQARAFRVTQQFSTEFTISAGETQRQIHVSPALGTACRQPGETLAEVLHRADAEMYRQKASA